VTQGKKDEVATIANGLNRFLGTVNQRSGTVSSLIDSAKTVTGTLANRDKQLVSIVDNLGIVVNGLAQRRGALSNLLTQSEQMAVQTSALVGANRSEGGPGFEGFDAVELVRRDRLEVAEVEAQPVGRDE